VGWWDGGGAFTACDDCRQPSSTRQDGTGMHAGLRGASYLWNIELWEVAFKLSNVVV